MMTMALDAIGMFEPDQEDRASQTTCAKRHTLSAEKGHHQHYAVGRCYITGTTIASRISRVTSLHRVATTTNAQHTVVTIAATTNVPELAEVVDTRMNTHVPTIGAQIMAAAAMQPHVAVEVEAAKAGLAVTEAIALSPPHHDLEVRVAGAATGQIARSLVLKQRLVV